MSSESAPHQVAVGGGRPEQPEPFLRGAVWMGNDRTPYPRVEPADRLRLPGDTWQMAKIPVGVRLELVGDATEVAVRYRCRTDQTGYRGDGAGITFASWTRDGPLGDAPASVGEGEVRVPADPDAERTIIHLPEGMLPTVLEVRGVGGDIEPAPRQPRWVVYGDSISEGWIASAPARCWPAIAGREHALDVVNLGYAGAARGEVASAEQIGKLDPDLLTVAYGTNCWTRTPHGTGLFREALVAFLDVLAADHPDTPLLVVSPVIRPDAEDTPNRFGATLADLREVMEEVAGSRGLPLVRGLDLIGAEQLGDGIHPDDEGHRRMAEAIGPVAAGMV